MKKIKLMSLLFASAVSITSIGVGLGVGLSRKSNSNMELNSSSLNLDQKVNNDSTTSVSSWVEQDNCIYFLDYANKTACVKDTIDNNLKSITIPSYINANGYSFKVNSIGKSAFYGTKNLSWKIIPKNIYKTEITDGLFAGLDMTDFQIPNTVTSIGDWAFGGCSSLTNINIPEGVTSIGDSAFQDCSSLTSIRIPDSVTDFGSNIFYSWIHSSNFKIYFNSTSTRDLFLKTNSDMEEYCIVNN